MIEPADKPKILWVNSDLPYPISSGCKKYTADLLYNIQSAFSIHLLPLECDNPIPSQKQLSKVKILTASRQKQPNPTISKIKSLLSKEPAISSHHKCAAHLADITKHARQIEPHLIIFNHIRSALNIPLLPPCNIPLAYIAHNAEAHASRTIANKMTGAARAYFRQDSKKLELLEKNIINAATATITLTREDCDRLRRLSPNGPVIRTIPPTIRTPNHDAAKAEPKKRLLITGSFAWKPKKENLRWFIKDVFIPLKDTHKNLEIHIVGNQASKAIGKLFDIDGIHCFDNVVDVYSHYQSDMIFVTPERQAGGIKIKTIEASSMGMPIVSTTEGAEGTHLQDNHSCLIANTSEQFIKCIQNLLNNPIQAQKLCEQSRNTYLARLSPATTSELFTKYISSLCCT